MSVSEIKKKCKDNVDIHMQGRYQCNSNVRTRFLLIRIRNTRGLKYHLLVDTEITAILYCNFAYLYWEGCVIFSIYLR